MAVSLVYFNSTIMDSYIELMVLMYVNDIIIKDFWKHYIMCEFCWKSSFASNVKKKHFSIHLSISLLSSDAADGCWWCHRLFFGVFFTPTLTASVISCFCFTCPSYSMYVAQDLVCLNTEHWAFQYFWRGLLMFHLGGHSGATCVFITF